MTFAHRLTVVIGASADFYERAVFERNQFNPKFGFTWSPLPETTVRVAAFQDAEIGARVEPDDRADRRSPGSISCLPMMKRKKLVTMVSRSTKKLAKEASAAQRTHGGIFTCRWSFGATPNAQWYMRERTEEFGRSYVYWALDSHVALRLEYLFERF